MSVTDATADAFDLLVSREGIVFIYCWAPGCGACRRYGPEFENLADRHPEVTFAKLNTGSESELARSLEIRHVPNLLVYRDGRGRARCRARCAALSGPGC